jgi:hypothetical protein
MITSALLAVAAMSAAQPSDPTRVARDALYACMRTFTERSVEERMTQEAFAAALPRQCADQERAFRQAIATAEQGYRTPAAEIERIAAEEVADVHTNTRERFITSITPR